MLHSFQQETFHCKKRGIHIINSKTLPVISTEAGIDILFSKQTFPSNCSLFSPTPTRLQTSLSLYTFDPFPVPYHFVTGESILSTSIPMDSLRFNRIHTFPFTPFLTTLTSRFPNSSYSLQSCLWHAGKQSFLTHRVTSPIHNPSMAPNASSYL